MRAVKSVSIDSERRVIITYLDGSTETLYPNCIWCDSEALRQLIKDLLEEKADAITQTIENVTIATFADGADEGLIKKLLVSIEPIQEGSGDPSPDNVRPISGRTGLSMVRYGKNLFLPMASGGQSANVSFVRNNDGSVTFTGRANGTTRTPTIGDVRLPPGNYILSGVTEGSESTYGLRISDYTTGSQVVLATIYSGEAEFTLTKESLIRVIGRFSADKTDAYNVTMHPMIRFASASDESYEPYNQTSYPVNWETEAGTVYGGYVDVVSGKLMVDHGELNLQNTAGTVQTINELTCVALVCAPLKSGDTRDVVCSHLKFAGTTASSVTNGGITNRTGNYYNLAFCLPSAFTTVAEFREWASTNSVKVIVPLATPTEIQLTPQEVRTLLGENNIWADSGNILELEYIADTKLYIGEQQSGTSGALGVGRQTVTIPDLQPVSEKTWEDAETYQEEVTDERGEE